MNLLPLTTLTTAVTQTVTPWIPFDLDTEDQAPRHLDVQANFKYGAGGTSVTAYVQTSFDGGLTAVDIICFGFTTSSAEQTYNLSSLTPKTTAVVETDGALTANTAVDGLIGQLIRLKWASVGTYSGGTTLEVDFAI